MELVQEVAALACRIHGEPDLQLELLCPAVCEQLQARLRRGVRPEDCRASFVCAAALTAVSMLEAVCSGGLESMDAGTLALRFGKEDGQLTRLARGILAPWCDDGTAFRGVRA